LKAVLLVLVAAGSAVTAGCSGAAGSAPNAPVLQVVTGLYPLAQAAIQIGQSKVSVTDIVPPGVDPMDYELTPAQTTEVAGADMAVEVGGGFQPSFERAAASAHRVVSVLAATGSSDPYVWLDPSLMERAIGALATAMQQANPAAARLYQAGARGFTAELESTGIDYESTLSVCGTNVIFTPDRAFVDMAQQYGLQDKILDSAGSIAAVRDSSATTLFSEPWVSDDLVDQIASEAHKKVRNLDTLAGAPQGGWPRQANYINLLEADLGTLSSALGCPNEGTSS
jgi:zinc transport system substrate-binding protein